MPWFNILFPAAMLLFPATFATLYPDQSKQAQDLSGRVAALWAATLAAVASVTAVVWGLDFAEGRFLWVLFFPLWFRMAMPILIKKNPSWCSPYSATQVRSASLVTRETRSPVPAGAWWIQLSLWVVGVLSVALLVPAGERTSRLALMAWGLQSGGLLWVLLGPWMARAMLREPEPMDSGNSPELQQAYSRLRKLKAWGVYALASAAVALFSGIGILVVWSPVPNLAAWVGGIGGSLVGLAGGVFGTVCSLRRVQTASLLRELEESE